MAGFPPAVRCGCCQPAVMEMSADIKYNLNNFLHFHGALALVQSSRHAVLVLVLVLGSAL